MSMARAVSWAVLSQPSVQWTTTEALCFSISSAMRTAPPSTPYSGQYRQEIRLEVTPDVKQEVRKYRVGRRRMGRNFTHTYNISCQGRFGSFDGVICTRV